MTTPRFKESGHRRYDRLSLGKPHIFFCELVGAWVVARVSESSSLPGYKDALSFSMEQDNRWTPRDRKSQLHKTPDSA